MVIVTTSGVHLSNDAAAAAAGSTAILVNGNVDLVSEGIHECIS